MHCAAMLLEIKRKLCSVKSALEYRMKLMNRCKYRPKINYILHGNSRKLAAMLRWFTAGGAIRIAVRQLSQTWKLRPYDVIDDVITRKL